MKKIISITLTLLLLIQLPAFAVKKPFKDVPDSHWASDAIEYFYGEKVIDGMSENEFSPDTFVTREQFAKLLSVIFGKTATENVQTFSDVKKDRWSYSYIESVKEYLTGYYPEGAAAFFSPEGKATREDIAYALAKISNLKIKQNTKALDIYKDANQISPALREYVAAAVDAGLIYGYEEYLRPQDFLTRAEAAMLLYRSIKRPVETDEVKDKDKEKPSVPDKEDKKENPKKDAPSDKKDKENKKDKDFSGYDYAVFTNDIESVGSYRDDKVSGNITAKWSPTDKKAEFIAEVKCFGDGLEAHFSKAENECIIKLEELSVCYRNKIQGIYSVTINGTLKEKKIGTVYFDKGGVYFRFDDEEAYFLCGEYSKFHISEEKADNSSDDGTDILLDIKSVSEKQASGNASLHFDKEKTKIKFKADYTLEGKKYKVTLTSFEIRDDDIEGLFNIECDGKVVAENIKGEMDGDIKAGEEFELEIESENIDIKMIITEISK